MAEKSKSTGKVECNAFSLKYSTQSLGSQGKTGTPNSFSFSKNGKSITNGK